jgi:hypothetical protein
MIIKEKLQSLHQKYAGQENEYLRLATNSWMRWLMNRDKFWAFNCFYYLKKMGEWDVA